MPHTLLQTCTALGAIKGLSLIARKECRTGNALCVWAHEEKHNVGY